MALVPFQSVLPTFPVPSLVGVPGPPLPGSPPTSAESVHRRDQPHWTAAFTPTLCTIRCQIAPLSPWALSFVWGHDLPICDVFNAERGHPLEKAIILSPLGLPLLGGPLKLDSVTSPLSGHCCESPAPIISRHAVQERDEGGSGFCIQTCCLGHKNNPLLDLRGFEVGGGWPGLGRNVTAEVYLLVL